eukprot:g438.t1
MGKKGVKKKGKSVSLNVKEPVVEARKYAVIVDGVDYTPSPLLSEEFRVDLDVQPPPVPNFEEGTFEAKGDMSSVEAAEAAAAKALGVDVTDDVVDEEENEESRKEEEEENEKNEEEEEEEEEDFEAMFNDVEVDYEALDAEAALAKGLSEKDLDAPVNITLVETETMELFSLRSLCVQQDTELYAQVKEENDKYSALLTRKSDKNLFCTAPSQTVNASVKNKASQATPPTTTSSSTQAASWDIYDELKQDDNGGKDFLDLDMDSSKEIAEEKSSLSQEVDDPVHVVLATPGCLLDTGDEPSLEEAVEEDEAPKEEISQDDMKEKEKEKDGEDDYLDEYNLDFDDFDDEKKKDGETNEGDDEAKNGDKEGEKEKEKISGQDVVQAQERIAVLSSSSLYSSLRLVERLIQQPEFHTRQLAYRNLKPVTDVAAVLLGEVKEEEVVVEKTVEKVEVKVEDEKVEERNDEENKDAKEGEKDGKDGQNSNISEEDEEEEEKEEVVDGTASASVLPATAMPRLESFWNFECDQVKDMNVSSMSWNDSNGDLLVVGYSTHDALKKTDSSEKEGKICFWSLKSPCFPERIIEVTSGVSSLSFSKESPSLLAVGCDDGTVAIYDVCSESDEPALVSSHSNGKHTGVVWQVKWVNKGQDKGGEVLISISSDGKVKEWSMKKGFEYSDLMILKRSQSIASASAWQPVAGKSDGIISRRAVGLCVDFPIDNPTIYLAGTSDGVTHQCSCAYNEQYLQSYSGHTGPVYQVRCHPMNPKLFLTCSADWTTKLWMSSEQEQRSENALFSFRQSDLNDAVNDVVWHPDSPTEFATVTSDGRIELWDLYKNTLQPQVTHFTPKVPARRMNRLSLAKKRTAEKEAATEATRLAALAARMGGKKAMEKTSKVATQKTTTMKEEESENATSLVARKMTCVSFSRNAPVLVAGDCLGRVAVYRICGMQRLANKAEQLENLKTFVQDAATG